jgi:aspartate carbamoyltransferase regulatory subunit
MAKHPTKAEIEKEFTCSNSKCKKKCDEIWSFTEFGSAKRKEESLKGKSYCEECFKKIEEKIS